MIDSFGGILIISLCNSYYTPHAEARQRYTSKQIFGIKHTKKIANKKEIRAKHSVIFGLKSGLCLTWVAKFDKP
jgi:hypothetical protein